MLVQQLRAQAGGGRIAGVVHAGWPSRPTLAAPINWLSLRTLASSQTLTSASDAASAKPNAKHPKNARKASPLAKPSSSPTLGPQTTLPVNTKPETALMKAAHAVIAKHPQDYTFVPLGGCGQVGMNCSLFGYQNKWLMIDYGMMFDFESGALGANGYVADTTFIEERKKDLVALVVTHGHEDHIGGIVSKWADWQIPIYCTALTGHMLRQRFEMTDVDPNLVEANLHVIKPKDQVDVGPFSFHFQPITHSIPESQAVILDHQPTGKKLFFTGDWRIDRNPVIGPPFDDDAFRALGDQGVLAMFGDSTNASIEGHSKDELSTLDGLRATLRDCNPNGLTVATCFSSSIARIQLMMQAAVESGRTPVLIGASLIRMDEAASLAGSSFDALLPPSFDKPNHYHMSLTHLQAFLDAHRHQSTPAANTANSTEDEEHDVDLAEPEQGAPAPSASNSGAQASPAAATPKADENQDAADDDDEDDDDDDDDDEDDEDLLERVRADAKVRAEAEEAEALDHASAALGFLPGRAARLVPPGNKSGEEPSAIAAHLRPSDLFIIATGCQGEPTATLPRMAAANILGPQDNVIFSARTIPGNEVTCRRLLNSLRRADVQVFQPGAKYPIHVSGHPYRGDLEHMLGLVKPLAVVPVHGEFIHQDDHAQLAAVRGVAHTILPANGDVIRISSSGELQKLANFECEPRVVVGGTSVFAPDAHMLRDRVRMNAEGTFVLSVARASGSARVAVTSHVVGVMENTHLPKPAQRTLNRSVRTIMRSTEKDVVTLRRELKQCVTSFMYRTYRKRPVVMVHILNVV
ncbi:uncharacterized protein MONBRDRAFT_33080 [Monosiga brevicollis MX1]|uniref:Metallo-beta-lactamase domain-containing protein n=1 Tax=Monosiga brevicollis TaxID=81824 RepID=A9V3E6_MONBE|nr:uncharacterized protein MONBRDRAFT_33080 [Monosiga brevicollis MX1]EDQ88175.1 predicted protein [Monosiga brevicollis MX1]|eukprot:XP_001747251.1 hypothetical protein [Monosiga brevicollis MX1]